MTYMRKSLVYADHPEAEQDSVGLEIFTDALGDADMVQKLLKEQPRTLAKAREIAYRDETMRRASRTVT